MRIHEDREWSLRIAHGTDNVSYFFVPPFLRKNREEEDALYPKKNERIRAEIEFTKLTSAPFAASSQTKKSRICKMDLCLPLRPRPHTVEAVELSFVIETTEERRPKLTQKILSLFRQVH